MPDEVGGAGAPGSDAQRPAATGRHRRRGARPPSTRWRATAMEAFAPTGSWSRAASTPTGPTRWASWSSRAGTSPSWPGWSASSRPGPGRLALFLEGGYDPASLASSVEATLGALLGSAPMSRPRPPAAPASRSCAPTAPPVGARSEADAAAPVRAPADPGARAWFSRGGSAPDSARWWRSTRCRADQHPDDSPWPRSAFPSAKRNVRAGQEWLLCTLRRKPGTSRKPTPELENGDRGGWPPFSKHRCLGRGRCPSHSGGCAPCRGRAESHGFAGPTDPSREVRGQGDGRCESGAHADHVTVEEAVALVRPVDRIGFGLGPAIPDTLLTALGARGRLGGPAAGRCAVPQPLRRLHQARRALPLRILRAGGAAAALPGPPRGAGAGGLPSDGADHGPVRAPRHGGAGGAARRARPGQPLAAPRRHRD